MAVAAGEERFQQVQETDEERQERAKVGLDWRPLHANP